MDRNAGSRIWKAIQRTKKRERGTPGQCFLLLFEEEEEESFFVVAAAKCL